MRRCLRLAVAFAAACGVLFAAAPAQAAQPGVVADLTWYIPNADKKRSAAALRELGSKWVRLHVQWREAEPKAGALDPWWMDEYGRAIDAARGAGQKVLVMVSEAPAWASGSQQRNVPRDPRLLAGFLDRFARHFKGRVDAYEIWNEPNIKRFWSTGPDPAAYAGLLRASSLAVRKADPAARVVFGGLSGNDYRFLEGAYAAGAAGHFDVLGTHPYPYCGSTSPAAVRLSGKRLSPDSFTAYRELRRVMVAHGDRKPIWFTEFGWNTSKAACRPGAGQWQGGVSEAEQGRFLRRALKIAERDPYVKVALWYALRNNHWADDNPLEPEANFGLLRVDYTRKPAFYAFKAYTHPHVKPQATSTGLNLTHPNTTVHRPIARGTVQGADAGIVRVVVQKRKNNGKWRLWERHPTSVGGTGYYEKRLSTEKKGTYRIVARYQGTALHRPSVSPKRTWEVGRDKK